MSIRGNQSLLHGSEIVSGVLSFFLFRSLGTVPGLLFGFIPFGAALILTLKPDPDERELQLAHQINGYEGIGVAVIMAVVYFRFPGVDWFQVLITSMYLVRGALGLVFHRVR